MECGLSPAPSLLAQVQALRPSWRAASFWLSVPGQEPPEAPSSPCPPSSPAQKQPHAPPQPTAHKSLSPRDLACPFHVPAAGAPPLPLPQTAACQTAPQAWLWSGLLAPPPRGARGHFKGERTALPPSLSPEWGLSQAINARPAQHCANSPPEQVGPPPAPSRLAWGLSSCFPWMCEAKGLERRLEEKGGGLSLSLSHPPTASKAAPFPLPEKRHLPSKKVPTGYEEKRPLAWESQAISPQSGSGPVHFNSCTFMEDHKKGPSPAQGAEAGGGGEVCIGGVGCLGVGGCGETNPESCPIQTSLGLTSLSCR